MKFNKSFFIAMAAIVGGLASSCSDDGVWHAAPNEGVAYSFNAASSNYVYDGSDVIGDIDVVITRNTTNGELTLPITAVVSNPALVTVPEEVVFENGSNTAICKVSVSNDFTAGMEAKVTLAIGAEEYGLTPVVVPNKPTAPSEEDEEAYAIYLDSLEAYNAAVEDYNTYTKKLANYKRSTTITIKKNETWALYGTGTYLYGDYFFTGDDPGLEIYRSVEAPQHFRIEHWGNDVTFTFSMYEDGSTFVDEQFTGYDHPTYGPIYIDDLVDYTGGTNYGAGFFNEETNTFYFAVVYYDADGAWGYGYEAFVMDSNDVKSRAPKAVSTKTINAKPATNELKAPWRK